MEYSEAVTLVNSNYGTQASKIVTVLSQEAIQALAIRCKQNMKSNLTDHTIDRLADMESWRQAGWIANPLMQQLMDSIIFGNVASSVTTQPEQEVKPAPTNNKKPEPEKKPVKVEEEEDDGSTMFDLFG